MAARNYSPKDVIYIFASNIIEGYADGTFLTVARNEDSATFARSSQGSGTRVLTADRSGRLTCTLQQTSPSNAVFQAQLTAMELQGGSAGIASALVKDGGGNDLHEAATSWVVKPADSEYGNDLSNREWVVESDELIMNVAGATS